MADQYEISPNIKPVAEETAVDRVKAAQLLLDRIRATSVSDAYKLDEQSLWPAIPQIKGPSTGTAMRTPVWRALEKGEVALAQAMASLLPDGALYESVLRRLDLRPMLAVFAKTPQAVRSMDPDANWAYNPWVTPPSEKVGGHYVTPLLAITANRELKVQQEDAKNSVAALDSVVTQSDYDKIRDEVLEGWHSGKVGQSVQEVQTEIAAAVESRKQDPVGTALAATSFHSSTATYTEADYINPSTGQTLFMDHQELLDLFQTSGMTPEEVLFKAYSSETAKEKARLAGYEFKDTTPETLDLTGIRRGVPGGSGFGLTPTAQINRLVPLLEAAKFPITRTPEEIKELQLRMSKAGYFGLDPDNKLGEPLMWGIATDPETEDGWRQLIRDSITEGKSPNQILAERELAIKEKLAEEKAKQIRDIQLTDAAGIRVGSELIAQNLVGRKLDGAEQEQLVGFIHDLERKRAMTLMPEGGQTEEGVDVQAQTAEFISRELPFEKSTNSLIGTFNNIRSIIGRPQA
jgi:hypothetical protein